MAEEFTPIVDLINAYNLEKLISVYKAAKVKIPNSNGRGWTRKSSMVQILKDLPLWNMSFLLLY